MYAVTASVSRENASFANSKNECIYKARILLRYPIIFQSVFIWGGTERRNILTDKDLLFRQSIAIWTKEYNFNSLNFQPVSKNGCWQVDLKLLADSVHVARKTLLHTATCSEPAKLIFKTWTRPNLHQLAPMATCPPHKIVSDSKTDKFNSNQNLVTRFQKNSVFFDIR